MAPQKSNARAVLELIVVPVRRRGQAGRAVH
jgi:hypothetical protein